MATINETFPPELLHHAADERLRYFAGKVVAHPRLVEAYQSLLGFIRNPGDISVVILYGPTGVGKTTLRLRAEQHLGEAAQAEMARDLRHVPVVSTEVAPPDGQAFSWKDLYRRILVALHEPEWLVKNRPLPRPAGESKAPIVLPPVARAGSSLDLRWAVERSVRERRPAAILIDEAQHLNRVAGARALQQQMDVIKSLASTTGVLHVLIGTYELLNLLNLSAQLARRSAEIHFPRYRADRAEDREMFANVLFTFQRHMPLARPPDLVAWQDYLYEGSAGCIGSLKDWLTRALALALDARAKTLTHQHLQQTLDSRKQHRIAREIREGEEMLNLPAGSQHTVRVLLGMDAPHAEPAPKPGKKHPVGKRTPKRDGAHGSTQSRHQEG